MHPSLLPYYTHTLVLQITPDEQRRRLSREGKEGLRLCQPVDPPGENIFQI